MAWQRFGDTWADDPRLLAVMALPGADDRTLNEVRGFIATLSGESAKYTTDYVLNWGQVVKAAGSVGRAGALTDMCVEVKLMERVDVGGLPGVKLVEDPDFIHLIKKAEADWNRQRKRDNADPNLKWPVILRDGDHCRYCHHEVHWTGKMSNRKATLDHRVPGQPGTVDTLVVACARCNSARRDDEDGTWDQEHPLLPPPARPYYGNWSRKHLVERGLLEADAPVGADSDTIRQVDASGPDQAGQVVPALGTPPASSQPATARPKGLQVGNPGTADLGAPAGSSPASETAPAPVSASQQPPPPRRMRWGPPRHSPRPDPQAGRPPPHPRRDREFTVSSPGVHHEFGT
ncbi:HNH endonuclease, partial [Actinomyces ruminicola]|uniref:HNH endonuclease n=1 Tax=Actinomyces ruminicola TaxID=332524 RepID=UPI0011C75640